VPERVPFVSFPLMPRPPTPTLFPYTTLFRSDQPTRHQEPTMTKTTAQAAALVLSVLMTAATVAGMNGIATKQYAAADSLAMAPRSEEHTAELQSRGHVVRRHPLDYNAQKARP